MIDRKMLMAGMLGALAGAAGGVRSFNPFGKGSANNARHGKKGIAERIRDAKTLTELDALAAEAKTYSGASAKTKRRWAEIIEYARKRIGGV